ncbi:unnamed protein product [Rhizophagus irregularis]|nr:unnamed protein product [Rhizophagus irregularis]
MEVTKIICLIAVQWVLWPTRHRHQGISNYCYLISQHDHPTVHMYHYVSTKIASQLELYLPFGSNSNKFASVICVQDPKHIKKATRSAVTGAYDAQYQFSQYSSANLIIDC